MGSGTACRVLASSECQPLSPGESWPFNSCSKNEARGRLCVHCYPSHLSSSLKVVHVVFCGILFFTLFSSEVLEQSSMCGGSASIVKG